MIPSLFFQPCLWHMEAPGPGIKPMPQQWPKQLQWQHWIFNPLHHKRTPFRRLLLLLHEVCILSSAIILVNFHIYVNSITNTLNWLRTLYPFWNTLYLINGNSWSAFPPSFSHQLSPSPYFSLSREGILVVILDPSPFQFLYSILIKCYRFFLSDVSPFYPPLSLLS